MNIYVAEISGRANAAMNAENVGTAEDWSAGPAFHSELLRLRDEEGDPLWDGEAEIHVRPAPFSRTENMGTEARRSGPWTAR
jgi:hypothetical protein